MSNLPLSWRVRKSIWNRIITTKFGFEKPIPIMAPPEVSDKIGLRPFSERYPDIPTEHIQVAAKIPGDEKTTGKLIGVRGQENFNSLYGAMQDGLPEIPADGRAAQQAALTKGHLKYMDMPLRPKAFDGDGLPDLGVMAVESPYALFLEKDKDGSLVWDLAFMSKYEVHPGLRKLGAHVTFTLSDDETTLSATKITCDLGTLTPKDTNWEAAVAMALCSATTFYSVGLHLIQVHYCMTDKLALATRNNLPTSHPLFRLLWPHFVGTQNGNDLATYIQIAPNGDFVNMYAVTPKGLAEMMDDAYIRYRASSMNPMDDWKARGLDGSPVKQPVYTNMTELWEVLKAHPDRYIAHYYKTDKALAEDPAVQAWVQDLEDTVPNGVKTYFPKGIKSIKRSTVAHFIAAFMHLGIGLHGILGNTLWHYNTWPHKNPLRLYKNGQRIPVDVYQRIVNQIFVINVRRAPLLGDYSAIALDADGVALFRQFQQECEALQTTYPAKPEFPWRQEPEDLQISMNAFG